VIRYEGGGASALLGVSFHTIPNRIDGTMDLKRVRQAVRPDDPHYPRTAAVCLENTFGGRVLTAEYIDAVGALCKEVDIRFVTKRHKNC
jgi:threonine aldolase